jgi:hypothetical protein
MVIDTDRVNTYYDVYNIAQKLGYTNLGIHPWWRLSYHQNNYLIYGDISVDDYIILATFLAKGDEVRY